MTPSDLAIISLIGTAVIAPSITLLTLWFKNKGSSQERRDKEYEQYVTDLKRTVLDLQNQINEMHKGATQREEDIRTIQTELKNRDAEYIKIFQSHTTLRAQYENLSADHSKLKADYDLTSAELIQLKEDIRRKADETAKSIQQI
jgi:peptidoglycan hydrolase CwlO-like protein